MPVRRRAFFCFIGFFLQSTSLFLIFCYNVLAVMRKREYKMKKTNDFGRDSIPLLVLKISVPFMFAQLVNVLYSIVDRIYVGNIPVTGADALAGVGVCAPIVTIAVVLRDAFRHRGFCSVFGQDGRRR